MGRLLYVLSCACFVLCLAAAPGFGGNGSPDKSKALSAEEAESVKNTSLYTYYQQYLNPYLSKAPGARTVDNNRPQAQKGTLASPPSATLLMSRPKDGGPGEGGGPEEKPYVSLKRLDSVGLEAINKTFPQEYRKEYLTELSLGIKLSPELDLSFGKVQKFERSEGTPWGAHDDGWRLRLEKNF